MNLKPTDWHNRYKQQAQWTQDLRHYLLQRAGISPGKVVLEVGSGSGAIMSDFHKYENICLFGVDIDLSILTVAPGVAPQARLINADGNLLPIKNACCDISYCHYLLLWLKDPQKVLSEMMRVTKQGGAVIVMAEPDYGGRIDFPQELSQLGKWQTESLLNQGTDPFIGRKLAKLFISLGLDNIEVGVMGGQWHLPYPPYELNLEWDVLESDIADLVPRETIQQLKALNETSYSNGTRILYVPTFYAFGLVP